MKKYIDQVLEYLDALELASPPQSVESAAKQRKDMYAIEAEAQRACMKIKNRLLSDEPRGSWTPAAHRAGRKWRRALKRTRKLIQRAQMGVDKGLFLSENPIDPFPGI